MTRKKAQAARTAPEVSFRSALTAALCQWRDESGTEILDFGFCEPPLLSTQASGSNGAPASLDLYRDGQLSPERQNSFSSVMRQMQRQQHQQRQQMHSPTLAPTQLDSATNMVTPDAKTSHSNEHSPPLSSPLPEPELLPPRAVRLSRDQVCFPPTLSAQQRRTVHVVAAELGLFHTSRDETTGRVISVSRAPPDLQDLHSEHEPSARAGVPKPVIRYAYYTLDEEQRRRRVQQVEAHLEGWAGREELWQLSSEQVSSAAAEGPYAAAEEHLVHMLRTFRASLLHSPAASPALSLKEQISLRNEPSIHCSDRVRFSWVDSSSTLHAMAAHLARCRVMALDLEMHSARSFHGHCCLLQISTSALYSPSPARNPGQEWAHHDSFDYDYVVDVLALWEQVGAALDGVMGDPAVLKLVHGAGGGDVPALFRDFGLVLVSAFDTQEACTLLRQNSQQQEEKDGRQQQWWWGGKVGLGSVLTTLKAPTRPSQEKDQPTSPLAEETKLFATFDELKRRLATADWRARPLPPDMLAYARTDTRFLIPLCARLLHLLCEDVPEDDLSRRELVNQEDEDMQEDLVEDEEQEEQMALSWHDVPSPPRPRTKRPLLQSRGLHSRALPGPPAAEQEGLRSGTGFPLKLDLEESLEEETALPALLLPAPFPPAAPHPTPRLCPVSPRSVERYCRALGRNVLGVLVSTMRSATMLWSPGAAPAPLSELLGGLSGCPPSPRPPSKLFKKIDAFKRLKKSRKWSAEHSHVLMRLAEWRQSVAFEADESPAFVCPSALLCQIALAAVPAPGTAPDTLPSARLESPVDLLRLQSPLPPFLFLPFSSCSPSPPGSPGSQHPSSSSTSYSSGDSLSHVSSPHGGERRQQPVGGGALGVLMVVSEARREFAQQQAKEQRELLEQHEQEEELKRREQLHLLPHQQSDDSSSRLAPGVATEQQRGEEQQEEHGSSWTVVPRSPPGAVLRARRGSWLSLWREGCSVLLGRLAGENWASTFFSPSALLSVAALLLLARARGVVNVHRGGDAS